MDYGRFLDAVSARAGLSPQLAERLTAAVLRTLAEHIDAGEAFDLAGLLPEQLRGHLVKERVTAESFPLDEFVQRVALRADADRARAERAVRGVLDVLHDVVGDTEWAELMAQLPLDFRELAGTAPSRESRRAPGAGG
jgi:uncharacterized protein (DUF2267 family)